MKVQVGLYEGSTFFDSVIKVYCMIFRIGNPKDTHSCLVKVERKIESLPGYGPREASMMSYPGKWTLHIYNIKGMTETKSEAIWNEALELVKANKGYDFMGILAYVCPAFKHAIDKYFCSEMVDFLLEKYGIDICPALKPDKTAPADQGASNLIVLDRTITN